MIWFFFLLIFLCFVAFICFVGHVLRPWTPSTPEDDLNLALIPFDPDKGSLFSFHGGGRFLEVLFYQGLIYNVEPTPA